MRLVALAGHVTSQRFGRLMGRQHGLTPSGAAVLTVLGWGAGRGVEVGMPGRATHAELARRVLLTPATLTGVVDTLEKSGYVRRERDATDRRVVWLVLTEAGQQRLHAIGTEAAGLFHLPEAACDPAKEKIVREFLTELIINNYEKE